MAGMETKSLQEQANAILEKAKQRGLESNFLFRTTFERYMVQLNTLELLKADIEERGTLTTKSYVKGRENLVINPAVHEFNSTTTSANHTVSTLMSIIQKLSSEAEKGGSKLSDFMSAFKDDDD